MADPKPPHARRRRNARAGFRQLPKARKGRTPPWPTVMGTPTALEKKIWRELWTRPVAIIWAEIGDVYTPAQYARCFAALQVKFSARLSNELRALDAKLGLSLRAAQNLRIEVADDPPVELVDEAKVISMQRRVPARDAAAKEDG